MKKQTTKRKKRKRVHEIFADDLKNREFAAEYLRQCLEDGAEVFNVAVLNVARANGNIAKLSKAVNLSRTGLYRSLGEDGKPAFESIHKILSVLGFKLDIVDIDKKEAA